ASVDPIAVNGTQVTLVAAYDFHRKRLNEDEARQVVEGVMSRILKQPISIVCIMRGEEIQAATPFSAPVEPTKRVTTEEPHSVIEPLAPEDGPSLEVTAEALEIDKQRLEAAKNIFDAEEIPT